MLWDILWAAFVAAQFAIDNVYRLHTLVLGGTPTRMPLPFYSSLARLKPSFMMERMVRLTTPRLAYDRKRKIVEEATQLMAKWISQAGKTVMIAAVKAGRAYFKEMPH